MSAWGKNGSARSCEALLRRVERNDPELTDLVILPMKKFGSEEIFRLAKCLESDKSKNLRSLQASGHAIEDISALEALGKVLTRFESIALGDSKMGDDAVCALCRGMEGNEEPKDGRNALKQMDLSFKNIGEIGLLALLRVSAKLRALEFMDLSRNEGIGPSFDFCKAKESLSLLTPIFPGLTHLDLSGCNLDTKSCATLLKAMQPNDSGQNGTNKEQEATVKDARNLILKLNSNNLSNREELKEMMSLIVRENMVTELYISKCQIGDEGMTSIIEECCHRSNLKACARVDKQSRNCFLQRLDLSYNNLTSISCLAKQLHFSIDDTSQNKCNYFSSLRTLDLSGNPLGENIEAAILCNPQWILSLKELDLSHTSCEISGAVELIRRSNNQTSSLRKLNLFGNGIESAGFLELSKVLHGGHLSLEYLDLGGNGASESAVVALVEVLEHELESYDMNGEKHITNDNCENKLRVLVVGGNSGGASLEAAVKRIKNIHPSIDIARDKPKQNNGSTMGGNVFNNTPGTTW
eukprot:CAMPEP_0197186018 /NCGR_PEP_ID=MMETSP1423-20130617/13040_1 /TAXON_ID=476441 /ORGANISM="Pseudo-nitzschia heimii, Strain UNC1101" /LENGTH=524 /DNA_ID=CAMNT_0042637217 /DNA_START=77 /DNA_END=1648 /DNA_ORIENTATION=-